MAEKNAILREALAREAEARMREGFHCSEAVLMTLGPHIARPWDPTYVRLATGFAGGIGSTHEDVCGALVGGVMALGAALGRITIVNDDELISLAAQFRTRFAEAYGTTYCDTIRTTLVRNEGGLGSCAVFVNKVTAMFWDLLTERGLLRRLA